jgi:hypothetical protein
VSGRTARHGWFEGDLFIEFLTMPSPAEILGLPLTPSRAKPQIRARTRPMQVAQPGPAQPGQQLPPPDFGRDLSP